MTYYLITTIAYIAVGLFCRRQPVIMAIAILIFLPIGTIHDACGGNLLTNGNFATGDLSGWTQSGTDWSIGDGIDDEGETNGAVFHSRLTNVGTQKSLYQVVPVTAGDLYSLSAFIQVA